MLDRNIKVVKPVVDTILSFFCKLCNIDTTFQSLLAKGGHIVAILCFGLVLIARFKLKSSFNLNLAALVLCIWMNKLFCAIERTS